MISILVKIAILAVLVVLTLGVFPNRRTGGILAIATCIAAAFSWRPEKIEPGATVSFDGWNMTGENVVAAGTWYYDGLIPHRIEVYKKEARFASSRGTDYEPTLDKSRLIPVTKDGYILLAPHKLRRASIR